MTPPSGYVLFWSDSFPGTGLSPAWKITTAAIASGYGRETWDAAHVLVSNGLTLRATSDFLSGEIRSVAAYTLPVYIRFRAKLPAGNGGWPAGWTLAMLNNAQEVDIFECHGNAPNRIGENIHWANGGVVNGGYTDPVVDYTAGFHDYAALITPTSVTFYVDDVQHNVWTQPVPPVIFDTAQLRLSLSICKDGLAWCGAPDATTPWPLDFLVNVVEVWQPGTVVADTVPPTISITAPISGAVVGRKSFVRVSANVGDNVGVSKVELNVNNVLVATYKTAPWMMGFYTSGKPGAFYNVEAVAYDSAGNTATATTTVLAK